MMQMGFSAPRGLLLTAKVDQRAAPTEILVTYREEAAVPVRRLVWASQEDTNRGHKRRGSQNRKCD